MVDGINLRVAILDVLDVIRCYYPGGPVPVCIKLQKYMDVRTATTAVKNMVGSE